MAGGDQTLVLDFEAPIRHGQNMQKWENWDPESAWIPWTTNKNHGFSGCIFCFRKPTRGLLGSKTRSRGPFHRWLQAERLAFALPALPAGRQKRGSFKLFLYHHV